MTWAYYLSNNDFHEIMAQFYSPIQQVCKLPNQIKYDENSLYNIWHWYKKGRNFRELHRKSPKCLVLSRKNGSLWRIQFGLGVYNDSVLDCRTGPMCNLNKLVQFKYKYIWLYMVNSAVKISHLNDKGETWQLSQGLEVLRYWDH